MENVPLSFGEGLGVRSGEWGQSPHDQRAISRDGQLTIPFQILILRHVHKSL